MSKDLELAMVEMDETREDIKNMRLYPAFHEALARIRLDLSISPYVNITDNMCKWVLLAYLRSQHDTR